MARKKDILDLATTGITLQVSSLTAGSVGALGGPQMAGVTSNVQAGFSLASVAQPVQASKILLGSLKELKI